MRKYFFYFALFLVGCASMSEDHKFAKEMQAERLAEWEQGCHSSGGVVWTEDGKDRTKKCVSKKDTQEILGRIAVSSQVPGGCPRPFN